MRSAENSTEWKYLRSYRECKKEENSKKVMVEEIKCRSGVDKKQNSKNKGNKRGNCA